MFVYYSLSCYIYALLQHLIEMIHELYIYELQITYFCYANLKILCITCT